MSPAVIVHVSAGCLAILAGAVAVSVRKGERRHRAFGKAFVVAMLVMGFFATYLSIVKQPGTIAGGILAGYLVATAWMTVRREEGRVGRFEAVAMFVALGCVAIEYAFGVMAMRNPTGRAFGYPSALFLVFGSIAALAAAGDWRMIRRGGVSGSQRIARHVWRMCFALLLAAGSFFLGQQKVMPLAVRGSPVLIVLGLAPLALMILWLIRVRLGAANRKPEARQQALRGLHASASNP
jgi:uncharacterized membrane protein